LKSQSVQSISSAIAGILLVGALLLGLNSFVVINPGQAGVVSVLGKATDGALLEGFHLRPPLISKVDV
jgi:regulator of protease activity HflC (stomatin/prohibitin superfamily)